MRPALPQEGDVLVSNISATVEHVICIVPQHPHITCPNHDQAIAEGLRLAEELAVDAWLTEDKRNFLRIGTFRRSAAGATAGSGHGRDTS